MRNPNCECHTPRIADGGRQHSYLGPGLPHLQRFPMLSISREFSHFSGLIDRMSALKLLFGNTQMKATIQSRYREKNLVNHPPGDWIR